MQSYTLEQGYTTRSETERVYNLSYEEALYEAERRMNLAGGNWKQLYPTSNGQHFYQLSEQEVTAPDNTQFIFFGSIGGFAHGTH